MDAPAFVSLQTLFEYLKATPSSRCVNEGQAVLNAKHIITCGITSKRAQEIDLFAICLQTSALTKRPHEIKGTVCIKQGTVTISKFVCTCKAGNSGQCKHVAAVLILCSRDNILTMPQLSSTDLKCYWTSHTAEEQYAPAPLLEQECISSKVSPKKKILSEEESTEILKLFANYLPTSAYGLHRAGRRKSVEEMEEEDPSNLVNIDELLQLDEVVKKCGSHNLLDLLQVPVFSCNCCQEFYNSLKNVDVANVATLTKTDKEVWHKERQFRITGSRCYSIYTYGLNDWEMKTMKYFWPKSFKSKYTAYGVEHEAAARIAYCERTGHTVFETGLIISQKQPWLAYSADGIIFEDGKPSKLLEIKCPYTGKDAPATSFIENCKFLTSVDDVIQLKKKHMYYAQIQLGMTILNVTECDFVLYSSFDKTYFNINIKYDKMYSHLLLEKLHFNYFNKMLHFKCLANSENAV